MAARRVLAVLAASSAAQLSQAAVEMPSCATDGMGYNDPTRNATLNGAIVSSPVVCQLTCSASPYCEYFTWYKNTGGCWLQGINSTLTVNNANAVSGPVKCPTNITEAAAAAVETVTKDLVPVEKAVITDGLNMTTGAITDGLNKTTGASFPWWGWLLIGLAVALAAVLCYFCIAWTQGGKKGSGKDKTSRVAKLQAKNRDLEVAANDAQDDQPLLEMQSTPVYNPVYNVAMPMQYAPAYTSAAPVYTAAPIYTAAPVVSMAAPTYMTAQRDFASSIAADGGSSCSNCGNIYAADSLFCRKCGQQRQ